MKNKILDEIDMRINKRDSLKKLYRSGDWTMWAREQNARLIELRSLKKFINTLK